ncbi:hypothetical protein B0H11DRAFT_2257880 [Mycena galericulata]|nr:hypothetical protein B0H11DRAFT_2257880 [Mycena galericulata]
MALFTVGFDSSNPGLDPRTVTTSIPASTVSRQGPTPMQLFKSQRQSKAPAGLIVGVAIAVVVGIAGLFLLRWLFVRRAQRRQEPLIRVSTAAVADKGAGKGEPPYVYDMPKHIGD